MSSASRVWKRSTGTRRRTGLKLLLFRRYGLYSKHSTVPFINAAICSAFNAYPALAWPPLIKLIEAYQTNTYNSPDHLTLS